jgi:DNA mismatch repair protein MutS
MTNTQDLHIEEELLPLFDYTLNPHAQNRLLGLLTEPLESVEEIQYQQSILHGFIRNNDILKNYNYSRVSLSDTYAFAHEIANDDMDAGALAIALRFSERKRHQLRGKCCQLVLLFHKLNVNYLTRLALTDFPALYQLELEQLRRFFASFNLNEYELIVREKKLKVAHMVNIVTTLAEQLANGNLAVFWKQLFFMEANISASLGILQHGFLCKAISGTRPILIW